MKTFIALAWCALATLSQQPVRDGQVVQPAGTAEISGRVTTTDTPAQPVRHARVTLNSITNGTASYSTTTDEEGRFLLQALPAGRFALAASKPSFITINYGALKPGRPGTPLAIVDGQHLANLAVSLQRGAVITGRLADRPGQPVSDVTVNILRYEVSRQDGGRSLVAAARVVTDDRGVYRAFGLAAGEYVVVALPRTPNEMSTRVMQAGDVERARIALQQAGADIAALKLPSPGSAGARVGYSPVFYPGTTDGTGAATIVLGAGEERAGIDLSIAMVPTAKIQGAVTVPPGVDAASVQVTLASLFRQAVSGRPSTASARQDDLGGLYTSSVDGGRYSFGTVPAGTYSLFARAGGPIATPGARRMGAPEPSEAGNYWSLVEVRADGRDLDVPLTLERGMTVAGHVAFEGSGSPPKDLTSWRISLDPMSRGVAMSMPPAKLSAIGAFAFIGVTPGRYRAGVAGVPTPAGWYLESATVRGRETLDGGLEVIAGANIDDLTLTLTNQPTSLGGRLTSASGRAAPDYFLIVFSADKSYWTPASRRVRETRPATDGAYSLVGLPPGGYLIAALTDVEAGEWNDPRFLESLVGSAASITLVKGQNVTKDLKLK